MAKRPAGDNEKRGLRVGPSSGETPAGASTTSQSVGTDSLGRKYDYTLVALAVSFCLFDVAFVERLTGVIGISVVGMQWFILIVLTGTWGLQSRINHGLKVFPKLWGEK
ncbi:hypothetical protein ASD80_10385 [Devosia sp. Root635]|nr:hypothetical protein ASD80_10385 [Devosia sp. Root635]